MVAYRATVAKPYSYNSFIFRRKAWIAAGKPEPFAKPNSPAKPQRATLAPIEVTGALAYIDAPGTAPQVRGGSLAIRFANESERTFRPNEHRFETIVLAGRGASVTEAVRWLLAENVALLIANRNGEAITLSRIAPEGNEAIRESGQGEAMAMFDVSPLIDASRNALALRRKQFAADSAKVARAIVLRKIEASELPRDIARELTAKLRRAKTVMDCRAIEAKAASAYWRRWQGFVVRFKGPVHDNWRVFQTRMVARRGGKLGEKGTQFVSRDAVTPCNAAINYGLAVALARMTRVLISRGLDPACGFLHADKPGRFSLAYDALELIRPKVTDLVMQWVTLRTFRKDDFGTFEQGIVRLSSETAREVASRVLKTIPIQEYDAAARAFIAML